MRKKKKEEWPREMRSQSPVSSLLSTEAYQDAGPPLCEKSRTVTETHDLEDKDLNAGNTFVAEKTQPHNTR